MKLNNHGWGYKDMIIYSCIILILLFFAASSISDLYDGIEASNAEKEKIRQQWAEKEEEEEKKEEVKEDIYVPPVPEEPEQEEVDYRYYSLREQELKSATMSYLNDYNYDLSTTKMKITLETLINFGYMVEMFDQTGMNVCTGYSNVYKDNYDNIIIDPYVKCDAFYVTNGY